jgi:RecA-family ATPase
LSGNANHTRDGWVAAHPEEVARDKEQHLRELENFAHHLRTTESLGAETLDQIADWVEAEAKAGRRIIVIDPVTAATRVGTPWEADQRFLRSVEKSANTYGASVVLISHPSKGTSEPTRENLAGSVCYERFTSVLITLHNHEDKTDPVKQALGTLDETYNRTLRIEKAGNSWGANTKLAYRFNKASLTLSEVGVIAKKRKDSK